MSRFVHLHLHTQFSVLDGAIKPNLLVKRAQNLGQNSIAVTDHGNMHGAIEFYTLAKKQGIKPIIGCEVYLTTGNRKDRTPRNQGGSPTCHLTLLAMNTIGYRNLCHLITQSYLEGFYFKPRIDRDLLSKFNSGLICLSGCISGEFSLYARAGDREGARRTAEIYHGIFGDRYYLEIMPHRIKEQFAVNEMAKDVGRELGIPLVATNDCHYLNADDAYSQEVLMCIGTGKLIADQDRLRHENMSLHLKSEEEMLSEFTDCEEAVIQSSEIAARCELDFEFGKYHMPNFEPEKNTPTDSVCQTQGNIEELFIQNANTGLQRRFEQFRQLNIKFDENVYNQRLLTEIKMILDMGFGGYFLVVSDFILWAKHNDIPVGPGRGSAAGSLVAYAMFITEVDPIKNQLLFERFLNPERVSLPDIDVDFCIFGRDKVIDYVSNKYGKDKVAQIATFGTLKAKAAIKDVGRVLGMSFAETDKIAKLVPAPRQGFDYSLQEAIQMEKRLQQYAEGEGKELIELASKIEGLSRHTSTHAAGLIISDNPIVEYMPLMVDKDGQIVSQFSMNYVEKIGLVKFDFLGLKTLTVLHRAISLIDQSTKKRLDLNSLPLDDANAYKLISKGRTIGIFQLESSGITEMVCRLKPNCFEDIVAILALYRPGPLDSGMADHYINRKHKKEKVVYPHPILEPILKDTYGIILYQEQIMQIARDMGGYSLGQADLLRRAMGKKKPEEMAKQRELFVSGAVSRHVKKKIAEEVFNQMETFARYGFNRSHSVAYAMISYQTAYLKAHYPTQFMAALMTFEKSDTDKTLKNLNECAELGITVNPPDLNLGNIGFTVANSQIVFDLSALKGIGEKVVEKILEERQNRGLFKGMLDFCRRVDSSVLNKRTMESFIFSGTFDFCGLTRAELHKRLPELIKFVESEKEAQASKQRSLFEFMSKKEKNDSDFTVNNRQICAEWPNNIKLANEKESLGFYISGHPLDQYKGELKTIGVVSVSQLDRAKNCDEVRVAGVITFLKEKNTKKGDRYATFTLEDQVGTIDTVVWPDVYKNASNILTSDEPIVVHARLDISEERRLLIANKIEPIAVLRQRTMTECHLKLKSELCSQDKIDKLKSIISKNKGKCLVKMNIIFGNGKESILHLDKKDCVEASESFKNQVEELFGSEVLSFK